MYVVMCVRQHAFNIVRARTHTHTNTHTHTHSLSLSLSLKHTHTHTHTHTHQQDPKDGLRKNLDATNKFTPNTLEAKRRDTPVQTRFPEPEKSDGIWTNLPTSKMRESSQLFRDTFETYCRTAKNLNGKTAHYLAPDAKYPKADRLEKDIRGDKFV